MEIEEGALSSDEFKEIVAAQGGEVTPPADPPAVDDPPADPPADPPTETPADDPSGLDLIPEDIDIGGEAKPVDDDPPPADDEINLEDYPEPARKSVGDLRRKLKASSNAVDAYVAAGYKVEEKDGVLTVVAPEASGEAVDDLRTKNADLEARMGKLSLIETSAFKQKYIAPIRQQLKVITDSAVSFAKAAGETDERCAILSQQVDQIARMEPSRRASEIAALYPNHAGIFLPMFAQIDMMNDQSKTAIQNWETEKASLAENEKTQVYAATKDAKARFMSDALNEARDNGYFMLKKSAGSSEASVNWNKQVDSMEQHIKVFFEDPDPKVASQAFVRAASAEYLLGLAKKQQGHISMLTDKLRSYGATEASLSGQPYRKEKADAIPKNLTPEQAADLAMRNI